MDTGSVVILGTVAANLFAAVADVVPAEFVLKNSDEVGVPRRWLPWLAAAKAAGALGLTLGLLGLPLVDVAAATGLVLFFAGALVAHTRARVFHNIAVPATFEALAIASLAFAA